MDTINEGRTVVTVKMTNREQLKNLVYRKQEFFFKMVDEELGEWTHSAEQLQPYCSKSLRKMEFLLLLVITIVLRMAVI